MDANFANETIELMKEARLCAIDLGARYISTIHLFLADCKTNDQLTIRSFVFTTKEAFQQFYESQRVAESTFFDSVLVGSLPITVELEQTIRTAQLLYARPIMPFHLFLTASRLKKTLFYSILKPKEGLYERLATYYTQMGIVIHKKESAKRFWQRLSSK